MSQTKKYSKKKHLPLKVSSNENWEELHKTPRRYRNTSANWKVEFMNMSKQEQENRKRIFSSGVSSAFLSPLPFVMLLSVLIIYPEARIVNKQKQNSQNVQIF